MTRVTFLAVLSLLACRHEGRVAGDCDDAADNDGDGLFDCDDPGCVGSPVCEPEPDDTAPTGCAGDGDSRPDSREDTDGGHDTNGGHDSDSAEPPARDCDASEEAVGRWQSIASMSHARATPFFALLQDGRVLVGGGVDGSAGYLSTVEIWDPGTGAWTATGELRVPREGARASVLEDGRVIVSGGRTFDGYLDSVELWDPRTGQWTEAGSMNTTRQQHFSALLSTGPASGKVMVGGGVFSVDGGPMVTELYDPGSDTWTTASEMVFSDRHWDDYSQVPVLDDGSLLISGGTTCCPYANVNQAERFNPSSQTWAVTGDKCTESAMPTRLSDGRVLVAGGWAGVQPSMQDLRDVEVYDPGSDTWSETDPMRTPRMGHVLLPLSDNRVLAAGGHDGGWGVCIERMSAEVWDAASGAWTYAGCLSEPRIRPAMMALPDGRVLLAGGADCSNRATATATLYVPEGWSAAR